MACPTRLLNALAAALAVASFFSCGGSSPTGPSGGTTVISGSTGAPGPSGATITITSNGVSPSQVSITVGQSVTFINNDSRSRELASNPHPTHGSCPAVEAGLGILATGQTRLTQGFSGAGTCGFHDHGDPDNRSMQGSITIR